MEPPTSVPRYVYRPLENLTTIRVLALHTAPVFGAPLKADIVHIDRKGLLLPASPNEYDIDVPVFLSYKELLWPTKAHEDAPACRSYEAVSYCWGEATFTHRLWCENDWSYLMITPNLDVMLRRLRRPHKIRYLWIDAICLNQSDDLEKSEQVQLMGKIYEHARKVIFWMGEPDGEPIQALYDYIHSIVRTDQADLKHLHARFSEKYPGALYNYLHRPWFWRRWIIQEAILAADAPVLCGGLKINWRVFLDVVRENLPEMITTGVSSPDQPTQSMPAQEVKAVIAHISALSGRVYYMLDLLTTFHRSACSDPRDRLFALRGIALDVYDGIDFLRPSGDISFAVDYSKPWGVVYTDFARACVEAGHGRHILNKTMDLGSLAVRVPEQPSWVPDWSAPGLPAVPFSHMDQMDLDVSLVTHDKLLRIDGQMSMLTATTQSIILSSIGLEDQFCLHLGKLSGGLQDLLRSRPEFNVVEYEDLIVTFLCHDQFISLYVQYAEIRGRLREMIEEVWNIRLMTDAELEADSKDRQFVHRQQKESEDREGPEGVDISEILDSYKQWNDSPGVLNMSGPQFRLLGLEGHELRDYRLLFVERLSTEGEAFGVGFGPSSMETGDVICVSYRNMPEHSHLVLPLFRPLPGLSHDEGGRFSIVGRCHVAFFSADPDYEVDVLRNTIYIA